MSTCPFESPFGLRTLPRVARKAQAFLVEYFERHGASPTHQAIADHLAIAKNSATRIVGVLERFGYAKRVSIGNRKRRVVPLFDELGARKVVFVASAGEAKAKALEAVVVAARSPRCAMPSKRARCHRAPDSSVFPCKMHRVRCRRRSA